MKKHIVVFLLLALFLASVIFSPVSSADENIDIEINVVGSEPRVHEEKSVLVAGMWNNLKIDMKSDSPRNIRVVVFKGDIEPQEKNISSYYEWRYEHNSNNPWKNVTNYNSSNYTNLDRCKKSDGVYNFCIGISDTLPNTPFYKEEWKIEIYENSKKIHSEYFYLEKPTKAIAHSHGDVIYFYVDPFTEMTAQGNDFFTLKNTGNVPLDISVSYPNLNFLIEFTSFTERITQGNSADYHMSLYSNSWQPQLITDQGEGIGKVPVDLIIDDSDAFVFLKTAIAVNAPDLRVFVGHSKHELVENLFGIGLSFQYEKNINMDEGDIRDINTYISGDGRLKLDISSDNTDNVKILKILRNGKETTVPIDIHSTSSSEEKITVRVEAIRERKSANINYNVESLDGRSKTYKTHVEVNPLSSKGDNEINSVKSESGFGSNSLVTMIVVVSIFMALGYMIVSQLRNKRR